MSSRRWVRPLLAFIITFGLLAVAASLVRAFAVYQRLYSLGMQVDDPGAASRATEELARMDARYLPIFLAVALLAAGLMATVFALWRPKAKNSLPPPLPTGR